MDELIKDSYELTDLLDYWILLVGKELERVGNAALAEHGITYRQVQVIGALMVFGEMSQNELAERIQVEPSSVVRQLDRMEKNGWIIRQQNPDDRRVKFVQVSDQVEPVWRNVLQAGMKTRARAMRGISDEQLENLKLTLSEIYDNLIDE